MVSWMAAAAPWKSQSLCPGRSNLGSREGRGGEELDQYMAGYFIFFPCNWRTRWEGSGTKFSGA